MSPEGAKREHAKGCITTQCRYWFPFFTKFYWFISRGIGNWVASLAYMFIFPMFRNLRRHLAGKDGTIFFSKVHAMTSQSPEFRKGATWGGGWQKATVFTATDVSGTCNTKRSDTHTLSCQEDGTVEPVWIGRMTNSLYRESDERGQP